MDLKKVSKDKLIETLTTNKNEHRSQFLEAQKRYREKVIETLDERLRQARDGGPINLVFHFPEPVDYTREYDAALAALDWEEDEFVELTEEDFRQLVLNQWSWAQLFAANSLSYLR